MASEQIYSSFKPIVNAGDTDEITVTQTLTQLLPDGSTIELLQASGSPVKISVQGPQTALTEDDIVGVYPAPQSTDSPDDYLPHIALKRRTLPWERVGPAAGAPWLALLLVTQADVPLVARAHQAIPSGGTPTKGPVVGNSGLAISPAPTSSAPVLPKSILVNDLLATDPVTRTQLLKTGLTGTSRINAIAIPAARLKAILPAAEQLRLLCHVKQVWEDGEKPGPDNGTFTSIVVCGRLPNAGDLSPTSPPATHTALLVSLEKRDDVYTRPNGSGSITLVVLHAWTFVPSKGFDFREVCQKIRYRPNGGVLRFGNLPHPAIKPTRGPGVNPPSSISGGFDSLVDRSGYFLQPLETAEAVNAVIRSPLRPLRTPARTAGFAVRAASETLPPGTTPARGGPQVDYSHATAFELGKLLALADAALREDLRAIHAHINVPTHFVDMSNIPPALQKPYWGVDLGEQSPVDAQGQLAKSLQTPWAAAGGQGNLLAIQNVLGAGETAGVSRQTVQAWQTAVAAPGVTTPATPATPVLLGPLDTLTEAKLAAALPEVINAGRARGI